MKREAESEKTLAIDDVRGELNEVVGNLRKIEQRLATLCDRLPDGSADAEFEARLEMRGGIDCVRSDLIGDAVETLVFIASADDEGLLQRSEERRKWLANAIV